MPDDPGQWAIGDMLGSRRPDIPILVVQSGHSGGSLNAIPGVDFSKYPQIMAAVHGAFGS